MPRSTTLSILALESRDVPAVALDPTFGTGGTVFDSRLVGTYSALFVQPDGKAVAGTTGGVVRFNANGSADATFDGDGYAKLADGFAPVGVQSDGKVILADDAGRVARLNADGSPDATFAGGQGQASGFPARLDGFRNIRVAADGAIIGVGSTGGTISVDRLEADGTRLATFAPNDSGKVAGMAYALAVAPDGSFYVGGKQDAASPGAATAFVAKFGALGMLDHDFGGDGVIQSDRAGDGVYELAVGPGGKVVVEYLNSTAGDSWVRYDADGSPDETFARAKAADVGITGAGSPGLVVQSDGAVLVTGFTGRSDFAVARFTGAGVPDASFNGGKVQSIDLGGTETATGLAVAADGKVVVSGTSNRGAQRGLGLVRLDPNAAAVTPVALTASDATPGFGESVTLTATATTPDGKPAAGTVTFKDGPVTLGIVTLADGKATFAWRANKVGDHAITATYANGPTRLVADPLTVTVGKGTLTAKPLVATPARPASGQWMRLRFDYTTTLADPRDAAGTVTFKDNGTVIGTASLRAGLPVELAFRAPAPGQHSFTAEYSGNANVRPSTAAPLTVTVGPRLASATRTELSAPYRPVVGKPIQLHAVVRLATNARVDGGTVTFREAGPGGKVLGTAPVVRGDARLSFTPSNLAPRASVSVVAHYDGTAAAAVSDSPVLKLTPRINTWMTMSVGQAVAGKPVTITARLHADGRAASAPNGPVTFRDGTRVLGTAMLNSSGVATLTVNGLGAGQHSLSASYAGNLDYYSAAPPALSVTVRREARVSLSVVGTSLTARTPLTLRAAVTGSGKPGGTVTFRDGLTYLGRAWIDSTGKASLSLPQGLAKGRHVLSATYGGDSTFDWAQTSATMTLA